MSGASAGVQLSLICPKMCGLHLGLQKEIRSGNVNGRFSNRKLLAKSMKQMRRLGDGGWEEDDMKELRGNCWVSRWGASGGDIQE